MRVVSDFGDYLIQLRSGGAVVSYVGLNVVRPWSKLATSPTEHRGS